MKILFFFSLIAAVSAALIQAAEPALILHHGKIVTVDPTFATHEAIAVENGRITAVGSNADVLKLSKPGGRVIDLKGKMVMPGLMDSHSHPASACLTEFDHPVPDMETIADVLAYIEARSKVVPEGKWIEVHQVFITRLKEQRYPTKAELDRAAPKHPVLFATGPDASLNTLALKISGIDRNFKVTDGGSGFIEKDPSSGEPTGILRNCTRYVKVQSVEKQASRSEQETQLLALFEDYTKTGLTAVCDRDASPKNIELYEGLRRQGKLNLRIAISQDVRSIGSLENIQESIRKIARDPLFLNKTGQVRIIGIKTFLDGGMLTGSAYMREPWGVSSIYGITDPTYRGVLFIPKDRLKVMVQTTIESGLQFTAHSVGDGAVHALLDAYEEVSHSMPIAQTRPCISHSNFMSKEAVEAAARLKVMVDIQPAWLWHDGVTLTKQFGVDRMRYFQPLRSLFEAGAIAGGGSDHMQKIGRMRSINAYNPFLGMGMSVRRLPKGATAPLHPEEALSREQMIRYYTINNAKMLFLDDRCGSLEVGKFADLIVLDRDLLQCPSEQIQDTEVLMTCLEGKMVFEHGSTAK